MHQDDRTNRRCVGCALKPGYNRAVIDVVRDVRIGSLCRRCECDTLEDTIATVDDASDRCALCDRDGFYALPRWLPDVSRDGDTIVTRVDYDLDDDPLYLCDEHFHELADERAHSETSARSMREGR